MTTLKEPSARPQKTPTERGRKKLNDGSRQTDAQEGFRRPLSSDLAPFLESLHRPRPPFTPGELLAVLYGCIGYNSGSIWGPEKQEAEHRTRRRCFSTDLHRDSERSAVRRYKDIRRPVSEQRLSFLSPALRCSSAILSCCLKGHERPLAGSFPQYRAWPSFCAQVNQSPPASVLLPFQGWCAVNSAAGHREGQGGKQGVCRCKRAP